LQKGSEKMSERNLFEQFMQVQGLLIRYHHRNHAGFGVMRNPFRGQGRIMKLLKMQPEISQKDLSEILFMRPQSLGEILSKLEQKGYITRTPSDSDKRVMIVRLTDEGKNAVADEEEQPDFDEMFSSLSDEEMAELGGYLSRISDDLVARIGEDDGPGFGRRPHRHFPHGGDPRHGHRHHKECGRCGFGFDCFDCSFEDRRG
jgi:DNA-binding MarR family transcriptional regulator